MRKRALTSVGLAPLASAAFFVVSLFFVHRSFYGMRIKGAA